MREKLWLESFCSSLYLRDGERERKEREEEGVSKRMRERENERERERERERSEGREGEGRQGGGEWQGGQGNWQVLTSVSCELCCADGLQAKGVCNWSKTLLISISSSFRRKLIDISYGKLVQRIYNTTQTLNPKPHAPSPKPLPIVRIILAYTVHGKGFCYSPVDIHASAHIRVSRSER